MKKLLIVLTSFLLSFSFVFTAASIGACTNGGGEPPPKCECGRWADSKPKDCLCDNCDGRHPDIEHVTSREDFEEQCLTLNRQ